ncbi:MAG TPA: PfkB family carbohydrate kinase [Verrucomicrobiota bacterium]|nr:carbohydrate kinase [Verrucomicrobiales bacterium]HRI13472.1 PfkB family carbohydrate kinase [Verrucomicrobiota bacterium]
MTPSRFEQLTSRYETLRLTVVGDFCLDRYFDIDPTRQEISLETGLPVHNVVSTRCQPGAAGTILNNLLALGLAQIRPVGFCGDDGEGWELWRALALQPRVNLEGFLKTAERATFSYSKPLIHRPGRPPEELNRLDVKNWTLTPAGVAQVIEANLANALRQTDGLIVMDQVDIAGTGVVCGSWVPGLVAMVEQARSGMIAIADSRRSLRDFPPVIFKMNAVELAGLVGCPTGASLETIRDQAAELARRNQRPVFVTLSEQGIVGASAEGQTWHRPNFPPRGPIDIVGAGDAVTANLTTAMVAQATIPEALEFAMAAASIVIHQLGTTGTASVAQIRELVLSPSR